MWSGGKDSAYGLEKVIERDDLEIKQLATTISERHDRVTIHGVKEELLEEQAEKLGIPLKKIWIPENISEEEYSELVKEQLRKLETSTVVYSDIYLDEVRKKKEKRLEATDINGVWPLWNRETEKLSREIIESGIKAKVVAVDGERLDKKVAGREYDKKLLQEYRGDIDPCAEEGRFHTFVYDAPSFSSPIKVETGETVEKTANGQKFYYKKLKQKNR